MFSYRLIAAVAMVTVVAAIGWTVFIGPRFPGVGGPLVAPSAQPTVNTSPSESPVPIAAIGPSAQGRYAAGRFLTGLRYELPPSWGVMEDQVSLYVLQRFPPDSASYPRGSTGVYCPDRGDDWGASCSNSYSQIVVQLDPVLGSNARDCEGLMASGAPTSVDGMIATLGVDPRFVTTDQTNVTIGGFSGKAIDIKVAPNWTEPCKWSDGKPAGLIFTVAQPPGPNFGITNEELEHVILLDLKDHTVSIGFRQGWRDTAESIVQTFEFGQ